MANSALQLFVCLDNAFTCVHIAKSSLHVCACVCVAAKVAELVVIYHLYENSTAKVL